MNIRSCTFLIVGAGILCRLLNAQNSPAADAPVVITMEAQNSTLYRGDTFELKFSELSVRTSSRWTSQADALPTGTYLGR